MSGQELFDALVAEIKQRHPSFSVAYKDESRLQRFLGLLTYPFNAEFMKRYTTTLGPTVYFPSRKSVTSDPMRAAKTLAHERVHIWDEEEHGLRYNLGYASPQILALPLLILYAVLGSWIPVAAFFGAMAVGYLLMWLTMKVVKNVMVRRIPFFVMMTAGVGAYFAGAYMTSGWWTFLAVGALIPLAPWRSPWRAKWEQRGYGMTVAVNYWRYGNVRDSTLEWISDAFTTTAYYRMDPNKERVMAELRDTLHRCKTGAILEGPGSEPFGRVYEALQDTGMLKIMGGASA